jgi:hypothetical protein
MDVESGEARGRWIAVPHEEVGEDGPSPKSSALRFDLEVDD